MKIIFASHEFILHPSGILFWPEKSMAIVSDLHLEKGSHFAQKGFFLPPYDTLETLERIHKVLAELTPQQILILGDTFHDVKGHARLPSKERDLFDQLLNYKPLWITGNHDGDFVPQGFTAHKTLALGGITFNHEATNNISFEISGHFHPKVEIMHKDAFICRPCFIEDGRKMIVPSFGAYTGGLSITHPSISRLMQKPRAYALGEKIYAVKL